MLPNGLKTIGERARWARENANLRQLGLAALIHTSQQYVSEVETNKNRNPDIQKMVEWGEVCGVSPAWILFGFAELEGLSKEVIDFALLYNELNEEDQDTIRKMTEIIVNKAKK